MTAQNEPALCCEMTSFSPPSIKRVMIKVLIACVTAALVFLLLTVLSELAGWLTPLLMFVLFNSVVVAVFIAAFIDKMKIHQHLMLAILPIVVAIIVYSVSNSLFFRDYASASLFDSEFDFFFTLSFSALLSYLSLYVLLRFVYGRLDFFASFEQHEPQKPVSAIDCLLLGVFICLPLMMAFILFSDFLGRDDQTFALAVMYYAFIANFWIFLFDFGFSLLCRMIVWSLANSLAILVYKFWIADVWLNALLSGHLPAVENDHFFGVLKITQLSSVSLMAFIATMFMLTALILFRHYRARKKAIKEIQIIAMDEKIDDRQLLASISEKLNRYYPASWPAIFKDTVNQLTSDQKKAMSE